MSIKIDKFEFDSVKEVTGFVNQREVIKINNKIYGIKPTIACSSCLPSDFEEAKLYVECMHQVLQEFVK